MENPTPLPPPSPLSIVGGAYPTTGQDPAVVPNENLPLGALAGVLAAVVAAALWGGLAALTHYKIGFAAVGVGYLVGMAVRKAGNGHSPVFGYVGAVLALVGCVAGDVFSDVAMVTRETALPLGNVIGQMFSNPALAFKLLKAGFSPLDALFYFFALSAGYRNSFHH